jgi:3-deoxy-D-manno-octulosonic-acid transferase
MPNAKKIMRRLYTFVFYLFLPTVLLRLLWRSLRAPEYRRRWAERFGSFTSFQIHQSIWIHAVSVGEVQAIEPLVRRLIALHPDIPLVITTTTPTGSERVRKLFDTAVHHVYFPYDLPFAINGFLKRTSPRLLLMVETEIWPNLLAICRDKGIYTVLGNARLSEKSARGYAKLGELAREAMGRIDLLAAQGRADADRFVRLGVPAERVTITGSIKFDIHLPASLLEQAAVLRQEWGDRPVWVAASTHEGEDAEVLAAHHAIRNSLPETLLVIVPRHPERFESVTELCRQEGFNTVRRSEHRRTESDTAVFVGDTMGELTLFLAAADTAFVGGSLIKRGGHNVLEPAALGKPVVFGPHMFNFAAISELLLAQEAAYKVANGEELARVMGTWLADASERSRIGENGRAVVEKNRGAMERLLALIEEKL